MRRPQALKLALQFCGWLRLRREASLVRVHDNLAFGVEYTKAKDAFYISDYKEVSS